MAEKEKGSDGDNFEGNYGGGYLGDWDFKSDISEHESKGDREFREKDYLGLRGDRSRSEGSGRESDRGGPSRDYLGVGDKFNCEKYGEAAAPSDGVDITKAVTETLKTAAEKPGPKSVFEAIMDFFRTEVADVGGKPLTVDLEGLHWNGLNLGPNLFDTARPVDFRVGPKVPYEKRREFWEPYDRTR